MNRINKLLDKLKSDINDTKDIDNDWFVEQALTTLDELKKQLTLTDVSQQRELLLAYHRYLTEELSLDLHEVWVNEHLKANNCG